MSYAPGFKPVARDPSELPYAAHPIKITLSDLPLPTSDLIEQAKTFLQPILGEPVWNHSHRTVLFGESLDVISVRKGGRAPGLTTLDSLGDRQEQAIRTHRL